MMNLLGFLLVFVWHEILAGVIFGGFAVLIFFPRLADYNLADWFQVDTLHEHTQYYSNIHWRNIIWWLSHAPTNMPN